MVQLVQRAGSQRVRPVGYHVGDLAWRMLREPAFVAQDNIMLWERHDGAVVGLAMIYRFNAGYAVDLQVDPEMCGLERKMWLWTIGVLQSRAKQGAQDTLFTSTYGLESSRVADLEALGFNRDVGVYVQMVRALGDLLAAPPLPAGFSIRCAEEKDINARVELHQHTLNAAYTGEAYRRLRQFPLYSRELDLVAVAPDGTLAGLALCWFDQKNRSAEIEPLAVLPAFRRTGIGRALIHESLCRLRKRGAKWVMASASDSNAAAKSLYADSGFSCMEREYDFSRPLWISESGVSRPATP